jgi:AcrR family transcriptional regulator
MSHQTLKTCSASHGAKHRRHAQIMLRVATTQSAAIPHLARRGVFSRGALKVHRTRRAGHLRRPASRALSRLALAILQRLIERLTGFAYPVIVSRLTYLCTNMARTHIDKRSQLVRAAVGLASQNGFGATSLADIAREAEVPLGNVYYYFKTKDEIGEAIVELRLAQLSALRQRWSEARSPKDRLCACVQDVFENKDFLAEHGCAVGTFCSELHKAGGSVATRATEIFAQHLAWIESQFRALGKGKDSSGLAVHLLSAMQGVSTLAHAFHDSGLVATETKRLKSWIQGL